jgi:hypothetical protein
MPDALRKLPLLPVVLALFAAGCAGRSHEHAGVTVEREEIREGHRVLLKSGVSPRRATLGDPVEWTLSAELPAAAAAGKILRDPRGTDRDVRPPKEPVRVPAAKDADRSEARQLYTWSYQIRAFALGKVPLPAMRLPVAFGARRDTLAFPADTVAIDSLTPAATGAVLPDRGPITPELRPVDYAVAGVIALVLVVAILLLVRALKRRRAPVAPEIPAEPADVLLRREVAALRERGEPLPRDEFYDRLSLAIRDYAAAVTGITTRDRTTLEIVRELRGRSGDERASSEGVDALRRALARADLAKFARRGGGWDEAMEALDLAERLPEKLPARIEAPPTDVIQGNGEPRAPDARAGGTGGR